jgi:hypothetical protein
MLLSCGSSKIESTPEQRNNLVKLIQTKNFEITSDMAYPQVRSGMNSLQNSGIIAPGNSISQIDLTGNTNYVRIVGDSIYAELPYYGERQLNVAYNGSDTFISINGLIQDYSTKESLKDNSYDISLSARNKTELLKFEIRIFPNLTTSMLVNGPTRFPIRYTGKVESL